MRAIAIPNQKPDRNREIELQIIRCKIHAEVL